MSFHTLYHCDFTVQYDMPDRLAMAISTFEHLCRSNCCELKHSSQKYPGLWNFEVIHITKKTVTLYTLKYEKYFRINL